MSNLLTFGQLIDQLKVGQIAESEDGKLTVKWYNDTLTFDMGIGNFYSIRIDERKIKWRILPKYISFDEAKEILINHGSVKFYGQGEEIIVSKSDFMEKLYCYTLDELWNGKWLLIKEDIML